MQRLARKEESAKQSRIKKNSARLGRGGHQAKGIIPVGIILQKESNE